MKVVAYKQDNRLLIIFITILQLIFLTFIYIIFATLEMSLENFNSDLDLRKS